MTDTRPLGSPDSNYTVPQNQAVGMRIPEFVFRQLIGWALQQVRDTVDQPRSVVDHLFAMTGEDTIKQIKDWLRDRTNLYLDVSWPRDDLHLPAIIIEAQSETEDTQNALLGDIGSPSAWGLLGDDSIVSRQSQYAVPEQRTTTIYIASQDDRLTLFLYTLVKFILLSNKDQLTQWYDIHNLSIGGQVLEHDPQLFPTFGYFRMLTLNYLCLFDFAGAEEAAKIVTLDLSADVVTLTDPHSIASGVLVTVSVPSED